MARKSDEKSKVKAAKGDSSRGRFMYYCFVLGLVGLMALAWLSLLSYSPGDPPSQSAYSAHRVISNWAGTVGAHVAYLIHCCLGGGAYIGLLFGTIVGAVLITGRKIRDLSWRLLGMVLLMVSVSTIIYLINPTRGTDLVLGSAGLLGRGTGQFLMASFSRIGAWLIIGVTFCAGAMFAADHLVLQLPSLGRKLWAKRTQLTPVLESLRPKMPVPATTDARTVTASPRAAAALPATAQVVNKPKNADKSKPEDKPVQKVADKPAEKLAAQDKVAAVDKAASAPGEEKPRVRIPPALPAPSEATPASGAVLAQTVSMVSGTGPASTEVALPVKNPVVAPAATVPPPAKLTPAKPVDARPAEPKGAQTTPAAAAPVAPVPFTLPSAELLAAPTGGYMEAQEQQAEIKRAVLQQTMNDFGVEAQVVGHQTGPVITLFELSLAPGVKVAQVSNLGTDIARSLAVPAVRIVSPLPGKDTVGVEVPNLQKEIVRIRELMNLSPDADRKMHLPLYLGKDAGGNAIIADLSSMPHMLIAGTTGSGKSVCINTIIVSLLMTRTPQDVRLILVDPKMVEMAAYENLPHLLCPIVNDMHRAEDMLEWAAAKMDERYELLREANVKNIVQFNRLGREEVLKRFNVENPEEAKGIVTHLPYYVIIIDELADLIMTSSKEVESHIVRLAQKSRAVGIHLILATQRPSVNVVTGLIKSNMPCRISFRVNSRQDSRIVLDQNGADVLLGQGDMLMIQPGTSAPVRAQGTFVDDSEIRTVVAAVKGSGEPQYENELVRLGSAGSGEGSGERDELFDKAVEIVLQTQRGSVSLLQRRLQVGYSRASRIIDQMAEAGLLGDYKGSQARECLLTLEDWQAMKASIAADQSGASAANGQPTSV